MWPLKGRAIALKVSVAPSGSELLQRRGLETGRDSDVVGAAEVGFVQAVENAIDSALRKAVFVRPLADGLALLAQLGFESRRGHSGLQVVGFAGGSVRVRR